jgi:lipopolysaccharide exporter
MLRRVVESSVLLVGRSVTIKFIGLLSTLVLARVLLPEDFGLVAMALLVVAFIEVFGRTGTGQYVLRAKEVDDDLLQSAWTLNLCFRIVLAVLTVLTAPLFSQAFNEPALVELLWAFAAILIIGGFHNSPGLLLLQREQRFRKIVKVNIIAKLISASVAVTVALVTHSYWALVVGKSVSLLANVVGSYVIHPARPALNTSRIREIFSFSFWIILQAMFGYFRVQFDTLLVTTSFGNAQLGSFHTMKYLAFIPHSQILLPATQPLLRELSKSRDIPGYFALQHNVSFLVGASIVLCISSVLALANAQIVAVVLGKNWIEYREIFFWFSILLPALFLFHHATRICIVFGRSRTTFLYEIFALGVVFIPLVAVGTDDVMYFTSLRVRLELVASLGFVIYTTVRFTGLANLVKLVWCMTPLAGAVVAAGLAARGFTSASNPVLYLVVFGTIYATAFCATLGALLAAHWHQVREWDYLISKALAAARIAKNRARSVMS